MTDYRDGPNNTGYTDPAARRVDVGPGRRDDYVVERKRGGLGRTLLILLAILAIIAAVLFATGFWRVDSTGEFRAPDVDVSIKGGSVPDVDVDSKRIEVGTKKETIEVPKIETERETVEVPVVGVSEGSSDKDGADKN